MRFHFVHAADIHLGHEQYNLGARANDFARAYLSMVEYAIEHGVDFVLIAGDLFHHARADAWTLKQAMAGLEELRDAGIPVVAIEGNHDAQHYYKNLSWMEFLCDAGLLHLLDLRREENGLKRLVPFDPETRRGSWLDLSGARVYGLKYYGASTARIIEDVAGDVEPGQDGYVIMMLHAGMQGQVPHLHGGLTPGQLGPLRPAVDYIALGHVHKRLVEAPIFNPGSLETNSTEEMEWEHGFFHVSVDTEATPKQTVDAISTPHLRPFRRIIVTADGTETLDAFIHAAEDRIGAARSMPEGAVVELVLSGTAGFRRQDLPIESLKAAIELQYAPLVVRVRNALTPPGIVQRSPHERVSRADLERQTVEQLVYNNAEYRDSASAWTRLVLDVKNMASEKDLPANIADRVAHALRQMGDPENSPLQAEEEKSARPVQEPAVARVPEGTSEPTRDVDGETATKFDRADGTGEDW